jgi:hypothetical protein
MERQWYPMSKVQDTEVIRQGVGISLLRQRWNFACRIPGKGCSHTTKYYVALLYRPKQNLISKRLGKLTKGISFPQDHADSHKAANMQKQLADLHFEYLKHPAYSPDLAPSTVTSSLTSRNT